MVGGSGGDRVEGKGVGVAVTWVVTTEIDHGRFDGIVEAGAGECQHFRAAIDASRNAVGSDLSMGGDCSGTGCRPSCRCAAKGMTRLKIFGIECGLGIQTSCQKNEGKGASNFLMIRVGRKL